MSQTPSIKLSICISTYNRENFIGATLESIISQVTDDCEIVVLDCASVDATRHVVEKYACNDRHLRYIRQESNNGLDRNFDHAVGHARGDYCWLVPDDDLMKQGAIPAVLGALRHNYSLIIVNAESRDLTMSVVVQPRSLDWNSDRVYGSDEMDRLFSEAGSHAIYIGSIVIRREIWIGRDRVRYYGSNFIHVGVIFQRSLPGKALVMAEPVMSVRCGTAHAWNIFETFMIRWPEVVSSLALSDSVKNRVCRAGLWSNIKTLLLFRAWGVYSMKEYRRLLRPRMQSVREALAPLVVAWFPGILLNGFYVSYFIVTGQRRMLPELRTSRFHIRNWQIFKRLF